MRFVALLLLILVVAMTAVPAPAGTVEYECGLAVLFRHSVPQWTTCAYAMLADLTGDFWWAIFG